MPAAPRRHQEQSANGGYAAIDNSGNKRKASAVRTLSEDETLKSRQRRRLTANAREAARNICVAQWAINKHLDYISRFRYRSTTKDEGFNRECQAFIEEKSKRHNFDLAMRHSRERATRLSEAHAVIDGDLGWLKYGRGSYRGRVELVEGDRIRHNEFKIDSKEKEHWANGVRLDSRTNAAIEYAIADRTKRGFKQGRRVSAKSMLHRGYFTRFDQARGVTPFACALNTLRDTDESFDFARAKIKLSQMMGILFTRSTDGSLAEYTTQQLNNEGGEIDPEDGESRYDVDLDGGIFGLDLERGEGAELLESRTPATETTAFLKLMVHVAIRALDLPYSFWDESFTNFYGQRGSFLSYIQACEPKRADNQELLGSWERWTLGLGVASGEFTLPRGEDFTFIKSLWVPIGQPWWDPTKEIAAQLSAIAGGLTSPQAVCHATNTDFEENVDAIAMALEYAREKDVTLSFDVNAAHEAALKEIAEEESKADEKSKSEDEDAEVVAA